MKQGRSGTELSRLGYQGASTRSGGGKVEPKNVGKLPGAVGRMGNMIGDHITERRQAASPQIPMNQPGFRQPSGPTSGMGQGPGANREVMPRGSQGKR